MTLAELERARLAWELDLTRFQTCPWYWMCRKWRLWLALRTTARDYRRAVRDYFLWVDEE